MVVADGVAAILKIGGGLPGGIVSRNALPEDLVLKLRVATTTNIAMLEYSVDFHSGSLLIIMGGGSG